jgi:hypothetical protein
MVKPATPWRRSQVNVFISNHRNRPITKLDNPQLVIPRDF